MMKENLADTPQLTTAECLRRHKSDILQRWEKQVRSEIRAASHAPRETLLDTLPEFFDELVRSLEAKYPKSIASSDVAFSHAAQRVRHSGFDLNQILMEYNLLRSILFRALDDAHALTSARERSIIIEFIHRGKQAAIASFARLVRGRRLGWSQITDAALSRATSLEELIQMTLQYVGRAFRAQGSALLLADQSGGFLELQGSQGLITEGQGQERLTQERVPKGDGPWGSIFSSGQPSRYGDLDGSIDPLSRLFRDSGCHCVMGAPLRTKGRVMGVILVGGMKGELFTHDDLMDLQLIIDRVAPAIDYAQQVSTLQSRVNELELEKSIRERFVYNLTHDLRNPLTAARVSAQLIQRRPDLVDKVPGLAARIIEAIHRADRMIQDLLDSSRIQAGHRLSIHPEECDIAALAKSVCEEMTIIHGDRIRLDSGEGGVIGHWDCGELRRAIENLINNAIKYGAPDAPITIGVYKKGQAGAEISVHNFGNPIPEEEQNQLFKYFRRGAHASGIQGWGIGLTLVTGVTEAHGGKVSVSSDPERGTQFTIELPLDSRPGSPTERG